MVFSARQSSWNPTPPINKNVLGVNSGGMNSGGLNLGGMNSVGGNLDSGMLALNPSETNLLVQFGFQGMISRLQNAKPCGSCSRR